jgi:MOSC domain-containing protein YiiM
MATLLSVNVGLPKDVAWQGRTVYTGIWKRPVEGPRMARRLNIDGDGQGDLSGHGGEQRAVLVYQIESYRHWQNHLGRDDFEIGQFGENFTVDGLPDDEVCIGDRYRIGDAELEVTQPRVTCFRVGLRLGEPQLPALLVSHHRPGFYLRVITEGHVQAGDQIVRTRVGRHAVSVADIDALLYLPGRDIKQLRAAADIPALSPGWQQSFHDLLHSAENGAPVDAPRSELRRAACIPNCSAHYRPSTPGSSTRSAQPAPAIPTGGNRSPDHLRPQRSHRALGQAVPFPARTRRQLRRPDPVLLPNRRLPHQPHPGPVGRHHLRPGPIGTAGRGTVLICCAQPDTDLVLDL